MCIRCDHTGIVISGGRSSVTGDWQVMIERYYRWRVSKEVMITSDLLIIAGENIGASNVRPVDILRVCVMF